jgi:hypothetical protein
MAETMLEDWDISGNISQELRLLWQFFLIPIRKNKFVDL